MIARHRTLLGLAALVTTASTVSAGPAPRPVVVPNDFAAPANSRALDARIGTALRAPSFLIGDRGDEIITRTGPHSLNSYLKNLRVYARADGGLEIRFNIVPDPGDTFTWPPQIPTRLLVRLFDENGNYLTHFLTSESFAPTETVAHHLTTGGIGMLNPSRVLLLDSDGKSNVLLYSVNKRDLDYARIAEVGFFLRPVQARDMRPAPESRQWVRPEVSDPSAPGRYSCTDYAKCLAPTLGSKTTPPPAPAPLPSEYPVPSDVFANAQACTVGRWSVSLRSINEFEILFGPAGADARERLDPANLEEFKAATPVCRARSGEQVLVARLWAGQAFAVKSVPDTSCKGITLTNRGLDCP